MVTNGVIMSPMSTKPLNPLAPTAPAPAERQRLTVDVPPSLLSLLDHGADVTGQARTAIVLSVLAQHLPGLYDQAKEVRQRVKDLTQQGQNQKR